MRPIQNADGHVGLTARSYPIAADKSITAGQIVKISGGRVEAAVAGENGPILGVAAESHSGEYDPLNTRSDGQFISVYDDPGLIFECPAPRVKAAAEGTATTVKIAAGDVAAEISDDAFNGGFLKLAEKAGESKNTDPLGTVSPVTDYAKSGLTFTKAQGGTPSEGDVYEVYPPLGFTAGGLDAAGEKLILSATGAASIRVVGRDISRHKIRCMAALHALGVIPAPQTAPAAGTISGDMLAANAVTAEKIAANAVTGEKIKDGEVSAAKLAPNAVATANIQDDAVTAEKIADGVIGGA